MEYFGIGSRRNLFVLFAELALISTAMVDADTHQKLQSEYDKLNEQMTSLVTDFTTMNTQLMEHKGANYDLEKQGGMYKTQLKQLQEHVSRAETELRKSKGTSLRRRRGWSDVCWWCCCVWCVAREAARGGGRREDGVKGSESLWVCIMQARPVLWLVSVSLFHV